MKKLITSALVCLALNHPGLLESASAIAQSETEKPVRCSASILMASQSADVCIWSNSDIKLYVIHPEERVSPPRAPLLYLLGGPGSKGNVHINHMALIANRLGRTVLMPDTADTSAADLGAAGNEGTLECSQTDMDDAQRGVAATAEGAVFYTRKLQQSRLEACLDQISLPPSVLVKISTEAQAHSLIELRRVLELENWNVFGESYGGRLAVTLAALDGPAISKLVLDSPETPWVQSFWHTGRNFKNALKALSELCRDQYRCPAKRLRLEERLPEIISLFDKEDVEPLELKDFYTREVVAYARPTQEQLFITTFMALRSLHRAALMPYIAAASNDEGLKKRFGMLLSELLRPGSSLNVGFHHGVRCSELPLDVWYKALQEDKAEGAELAPFLDYLAWRQQFVCRALDIESPAALKQYPAPTMETLVLSGGLDPITPANVIVAAFPPAPHLVNLHYETLGHVVHTQLDCVMDDIRQFIDGGGVNGEAVESTCRKKDLKIRFFSPVVRR